MAAAFFKEPWEQFTVGMDFALALPTGTTIASGTLTVQDLADGADQTAAIVSETPTIAGTVVKVRIHGGTKGHLYNLRWRVTLNTDDLLEENATLSVQQEGP